MLPLRDTGDYTFEIRDATADLAGADFQYRLQVRPQAPHVGQVRADADAVNLARGEAKMIRVSFDREEDYRGTLTITAESLPPGVAMAPGADFEPEKDRPPAIGKCERYLPRTERVVLVLTAADNAPISSEPQNIRLLARPLVNGKTGDVVWSKTIPMMVLPKP